MSKLKKKLWGDKSFTSFLNVFLKKRLLFQFIWKVYIKSCVSLSSGVSVLIQTQVSGYHGDLKATGHHGDPKEPLPAALKLYFF